MAEILELIKAQLGPMTTPELLYEVFNMMVYNGSNQDLKSVLGAFQELKIGNELVRRMVEDPVEQLRDKTIADINAYVAANPRASKQQLQGKIVEYIAAFAVQVASLE
eukprot:Colp12_sorted_trinity150504_noHs@23814